ncbi:MAG: hypothetical protein K0M59_14980 [Stenotrophomonas sp.]|nr:hypothetical protein [Stenotrophomonas sp.]
MSRPHLAKSIDQLEDIYGCSSADVSTLQMLSEELSFRRTPRAKELLNEVNAALIAHKVRPPVSPDVPHPPIPTSAPRRPAPGDPKVHPPLREPLLTPPADSHPPSPPPGPAMFTNHATDILDSWSALEVLSPTTFKRRAELASNIAQNIVAIGPGLPWDGGSARSKPNFKVYFHIILGTLSAEPAFGQLLRRFQDARVNPPNIKGEVVLASILVDKEGRLAGEMPVSLSAFGWGLPVALRGSLQDLAAWTKEESRLIEGLTKQLRPDPSQADTPIRFETLQNSFNWLVKTLGLPPDLVQGPQFAAAAYVGFRSSAVPDPLLLNSFYLRDLAQAKDRAARNALPPALRRFLGQSTPPQRHDLLSEPLALEGALSPALAPGGRWVTPSGQRPALLQQAAVNLTSQLSGTNPILGVNGPPGTGKSTLLRDVVADQLTQRAKAMCSFDDPTKAFKSVWSKRVRGETQELYALDETLRGFEMVVASSNNKAVENVSAEMPALSSIAAECSMRYFAPLATQLLEKEAWGLMAAVLGNGGNRSRFRKAFWTESHLSFKTYLERVSGVTAAQPGAPPDLAELCQGPTGRADALERWHKAKDRFRRQDLLVRAHLAELETLRTALADLPDLREDARHASLLLHESQGSLEAASESCRAAQAALLHAKQTVEHAHLRLQQHQQERPSFFSLKRLFDSSKATQWQDNHASVSNAHGQANLVYQDAKKQHHVALGKLEHARHNATERAGQHDFAKAKLEAALASCARIHVGEGASVLDTAFHQLDHSTKNTSLPWLDSALQAHRSALFEAAIEVHRAFIDAAALPLLRNLNGLLGGNFKLGADRKHMAAELWSTLFLVVPVISTTFASVERMLSQLPDESLGWLLVDEAGQATPQSAVGALLRTKRALVVGDPLQVEPVVPLPPILTQAIMHEFGVEPDRFSAPSGSVQTLADDGSLHCARFETTSGLRAVGAPLLVHRRCASPMFDISNRVAYNNLMVQAKQPSPSVIRNLLGPSRWIDVRGSGSDKYSPAEGDEVITLLRTLRANQLAPDLYIITPFVVVQDELRDFVRRSAILEGWVESASSWVYERIGTVHTVQGREAQAVIFVLGAPQAAQHGARQWAGSSPNLLNVAVTRAKEVIYVIGNRALWSSAGHFAALDQAL